MKMKNPFKKSRVGFYRAMGRFNAGVEATVGIMQVAVISVGGFLIMRGEMETTSSSMTRYDHLQSGIVTWLQHPIFGVGYSRYRFYHQ